MTQTEKQKEKWHRQINRKKSSRRTDRQHKSSIQTDRPKNIKIADRPKEKIKKSNADRQAENTLKRNRNIAKYR